MLNNIRVHSMMVFFAIRFLLLCWFAMVVFIAV